jgi:hypothetical protein
MGGHGASGGGGALARAAMAPLQCSAGTSSAWAGCEARFQLLNPAWLRDVFGMRWALPVADAGKS